MQVSQGRLRVNGTPITIRGVNRHEHTPDSGHVVSLASMAHDIQVIHENNCFSRQLNLCETCETFLTLKRTADEGLEHQLRAVLALP